MRSYSHPDVANVTLEHVLHALSDSVRLEIVRQLAAVREASCGELDGGRPKSSMSHHFRILREAGLVRTHISGTTHRNALRAEELNQRFPGLLDAVLKQPA